MYFVDFIYFKSMLQWTLDWTSLALERPGVAGGGAERGVGCAELEVGGLRCSVPVTMSHM